MLATLSLETFSITHSKHNIMCHNAPLERNNHGYEHSLTISNMTIITMHYNTSVCNALRCACGYKHPNINDALLQ